MVLFMKRIVFAVLSLIVAGDSNAWGQFFSLQNGHADNFGPNYSFFRGDDLFSPPFAGTPILQLPGSGFPNNFFPVDVDAMSFGLAGTPSSLTSQVSFSVGGGAQGAAGSAVRAEAGPQSDFRPYETASDIYHTNLMTQAGTNILLYDGNGQGPGSPPGLFGPLNVFEGPNRPTPPPPYLANLVDRGVDALDMQSQIGPRVYFSVDQLSVVHVPYPVDAEANIYVEDALPGFTTLQTPNSPDIYASANQLGLQAMDNIDAIEIYDTGTIGAFDGNDIVLFSLDSGSPSLFDSNSPYFNLSPGDIFLATPSGSPTVFAFGSLHLGLNPFDDINAISLASISAIPEPNAMTVLGIMGLTFIVRRRRLKRKRISKRP